MVGYSAPYTLQDNRTPTQGDSSVLSTAQLKVRCLVAHRKNHRVSVTPRFETPSYWVNYEDQLAHAANLWDGDLPTPPVNFIPKTVHEVPLLVLPFDHAQWLKLIAEKLSYTLHTDRHFADPRYLMQRAPHAPALEIPTWMGFDPLHHPGRRPGKLWEHNNIAGNEVFASIVMFPGLLEWLRNHDVPAINLAGCRLVRNKHNELMPRIIHWPLTKSTLVETNDPWMRYISATSPSIRVL